MRAEVATLCAAFPPYPEAVPDVLMDGLGWYVLIAATAGITTFVLTGPARVVARKVGYVCVPSDRSVHSRITPYGGGVAMFSGLCVAIGLGAFVPALHIVYVAPNELVGVVLASAVILVVGLVDDLRSMSAPAKVAGEVLAACVLYFAGVDHGAAQDPVLRRARARTGHPPAHHRAVGHRDHERGQPHRRTRRARRRDRRVSPRARSASTGCASSTSVCSPSTNIGPLVAAATCGLCLGFLPSNFHPARLFMGDAGALLLGVLMSAATMVIGGRTPPASGVTYFFFAPLLIPFFILGVPLIDMAFAIIRRTASGQGFHNADKDHIHHRLLRLGHGHRRTVVILWLLDRAAVRDGPVPALRARGERVHPRSGSPAMAVALYTWFHPGPEAQRRGRAGGRPRWRRQVAVFPGRCNSFRRV